MSWTLYFPDKSLVFEIHVMALVSIIQYVSWDNGGRNGRKPPTIVSSLANTSHTSNIQTLGYLDNRSWPHNLSKLIKLFQIDKNWATVSQKMDWVGQKWGLKGESSQECWRAQRVCERTLAKHIRKVVIIWERGRSWSWLSAAWTQIAGSAPESKVWVWFTRHCWCFSVAQPPCFRWGICA